MSTAEKESVAPEVREVKWLPLATAFGHMMSSMCPAPLIYVNMWQQEMFALHGLKRRDPMFITGATLLELEGFPSEAALLRHAASADTAQLALEEQWLFDGMSQKSVEDAFVSDSDGAKRGGTSCRRCDVRFLYLFCLWVVVWLSAKLFALLIQVRKYFPSPARPRPVPVSTIMNERVQTR